jgi:sec-independent protein translocase protein TatC
MAEPHDEDFFAETRMSFGDHIEELRKYLWKAIIGFTIGITVSFFFGNKIVEFIQAPVEVALVEHYVEYYKKHADERNRLVARFRDEMAKAKADPAIAKLNEPRDLTVAVSPAALDKQFRELYPQMFAKGGPLADVEPPKEDAAALQLAVTVRPMDIIEPMQQQLAVLTKRISLTTLSVSEMFMVYIKVSLLTGLVLSSPWVFYQIWQFVAAGLYPHERKYVTWSLGPSIALFIAGVALCQFAIIPTALNAMLDFNLWMNVEPDFRLNEWLGFAILMPVITGLFFQTPLVMFFLGKIGVFTAEDFASKRRMAWFIMLIIAAVISPTVDAISLLALWIPMVALYEGGIWAVKWYCPPPMDLDEPEEVPYQPETAGATSDRTTD